LKLYNPPSSTFMTNTNIFSQVQFSFSFIKKEASMSKQDQAQISAKHPRSRQTSKQSDSSRPVPKQPAHEDIEGWKAYWIQQGQPWRIDPEIDEERQKYLTERRNIIPDIEQNLYPLKNIQLSRADIEWLLVTHEHADLKGPLDWHDESHREHEGLDLRGADLRGVDLQNLPLTGLCGGLDWEEWSWNIYGEDAHEIFSEAGIHLEQANLSGAHLEGASLVGAHLAAAHFEKAYLEKAYLSAANAAKANFSRSHSREADFMDARLEEASFAEASMQKAIFSGAYLKRAYFVETHLEEADFCLANLEMVNFAGAYLSKAVLGAQPKDEIFEGPHLEGASFFEAHLEGATLENAYLGGKQVDAEDWEQIKFWYMRFPTRFQPENMHMIEPADLARAYFDAETKLDNAWLGSKQHGFVSLADVHWRDVNITTLQWDNVRVLGEECQARQKRRHGQSKEQAVRLKEHERAVRTYRQLSTLLLAQGLNEDASRFSYRAQQLQRIVWRLQRNFGRYVFSVIINLLAGYGYKPWRSFVTYLVVIAAFALIYHQLGTHLPWNEAVVISMTAFHGRGFFSDQFHPGDPQALVAAIEAFVGLLIEVTFIATLTQRLFGK
jgi:uncharacterized protein YjbI with pentapeptide repeats